MNKEQIGIPKLRFPGFTGAWEQRRLGEVAEIKTGSRNHQDSVDNGKYPFFVRSEKVERLNEYDFDTKAILVPGDGRIGEIFHYYDGKFALHQRVYKVDNFKEVNPLYLLNLFKYKFKKHALRLNAQGTVPSLRLPMFTNWNILIPNLNEQQKIGLFFQQLDSLIALYQRKLEHLKRQKNGLLQKMFPKNGESVPEVRFPEFTDSWEQRKLGEIATFSKGTGYSKKDLESDGTPIILYGRMYTNYELVIHSVNTFTTAKEKSIYSNGGEVIVPASGETAEDISVASVVEQDNVLLGGDLNIIHTNKNVEPVFLALSITNGEPHKDMAKRAQGKSVVHLHNSDLAQIKLSYPSKDEQKKIDSYFLKLDSLIALHQRKLEHLELLKKGLLQQMFV